MRRPGDGPANKRDSRVAVVHAECFSDGGDSILSAFSCMGAKEAAGQPVSSPDPHDQPGCARAR